MMRGCLATCYALGIILVVVFVCGGGCGKVGGASGEDGCGELSEEGGYLGGGVVVVVVVGESIKMEVSSGTLFL